jgi:hypothetical protein
MAAQTATDQDLGIDRPGGKAAGGRNAAREAKRGRKARRADNGPRAAAAAAPARSAAAAAPARSAVAPAPARSAVAPAPSRSAAAATATGVIPPAKSRTTDVSRNAGRKAARRKVRHPVRLVIGGGTVAVVAAAGVVLVPHLLKAGGPAHSISTPTRLQAYVQDPALAASMRASALRSEIVAKGNGEASHVVDAVYEDSTSGPTAKKAPLILLFVGGNLSGSAASFIASFTGTLTGAFVTNPGSRGGQAACVPGVGGHPAECAWADGDTFGLIASPNLGASALANELRSIRPQVEHAVK